MGSRSAEEEKQSASQKEIESVVDVIPTAVTQTNHKVAADKQRFNTLGYQVYLCIYFVVSQYLFLFSYWFLLLYDC